MQPASVQYTVYVLMQAVSTTLNIIRVKPHLRLLQHDAHCYLDRIPSVECCHWHFRVRAPTLGGGGQLRISPGSSMILHISISHLITVTITNHLQGPRSRWATLVRTAKANGEEEMEQTVQDLTLEEMFEVGRSGRRSAAPVH